ncbi:MAG: hypothetical protein ACLP7O_07510 [Terracidiphilus sp.]
MKQQIEHDRRAGGENEAREKEPGEGKGKEQGQCGVGRKKQQAEDRGFHHIDHPRPTKSSTVTLATF